MVPPIRIQTVNHAGVNPDGRYVLYWMIAQRRTAWNFALDRAIETAVELSKPLVVLEALRCGYPWASDRLHRFILQGMRDNAAALAAAPVDYYPYVECAAGEGKGLVAALAERACAVVTDDFPCFFLPRIVAAVAARLRVRFEAIDSNGLLPLRAASQVFPTAYAFRRFLQKTLPEHLAAPPSANPLSGLRLPATVELPTSIVARWPQATEAMLNAEASSLARLPIDHCVGPAACDGGAEAARQVLRRFLDDVLPTYCEQRNSPEEEATSGLSPYLHFGHVSAHEVFARIAKSEDWTPDRLATKATGARSGWWGMSESAEAFLDQLCTWRELGYNFCWQRDDYDQYDSLPDWARRTLAKHARDRRPHVYSHDEFEQARTHDALWNAAQTQLVREGRMHNYLRMLWGKKILEWSETPQEALATMIDLNNKYAVDGRNPNSYSGIFWTLGRYDRTWGPERPIFGTVRYMSSENTARKYPVKGYIAKYGPEQRSLLD